MLDDGAPAYIAAMQAITRADALPAVFFCMAGKDRTGLFAAMVLGLLGVPDDVVIADYVLTQDVLATIGARRIERDGRERRHCAGTTCPRISGCALPRHGGALRHMRAQWGSWEGYAAGIGFPEGVVATLAPARRRLTVPPQLLALQNTVERAPTTLKRSSYQEGEDLRAVVGDGDRVLEVGRAACRRG